jgi:gamma-glutamylputrescine oxidase
MLEIDRELNRNSYYEASAVRPPAGPPLAGSIEADVCVLGAGLAGLSAALELAGRGYSVVVLERDRVASGASGRNGGQVIAGFGSDGEDAIEEQFSPEDARRAWDISMQGLQLVQDRMRQHSIDCDYRPGYLTLATSARRARELKERVEHMAARYGHAQQWLDDAAIGDWVASQRYWGGAFDPLSGHLHPLKYALGIARAARAAGVRIFEHSEVIGLERGDRPVVRTAQGNVKCRFVLLAGNFYLGEYGQAIAPELAERIVPVVTYIVATEPMAPERADALIRGRAACSDNNHMLDYFRLSADNRLLFGGGDSATPEPAEQVKGRMRKRMLEVFPQLSDLGLAFAWGGFCDVSLNMAPDFGRLGQNLYYLQGFSGHGIGTTGIAGKLVAEVIAGQAERFDLLSRIRHQALPGGTILRRPALTLAMTYYRLLDLI